MRYLGNKTRLLPFLMRRLEALDLRPGVAADPFAGTASVAGALKRRGWRVHAGDLMAFSFALQVARVELDRAPSFPAALLPAGRRARSNGGPPAAGDGGDCEGGGTVGYRAVLRWLQAAPGRHGFITEHYTPAGEAGRAHGRMYFRPRNARRIDLIREKIAEWRDAGHLDRGRTQLLLATLIEAADRVANTTGIYASFVKSWQPNAERELRLRPLRPVRPNGGREGGSRAFRGPARALLRRAGAVDLIYLDPPYNGRQYPGYYHIPELLAVGWDPPPALRGKTGLIPDEDLRSDWCRKGRAERALRELLEEADGGHLLFSYNDEGLLPAAAIEAALREWGCPDSYRRFARPYRRYRSDADGPERTYARDRVREQLHYVRGR